MAFTNKSKSNISLVAPDKNQSHGSQAQMVSDATAYSSAIRTTQAAQDYKIGKLSKYSVKLPQHQTANANFVDKR
jgi:hypothetical protein